MDKGTRACARGHTGTVTRGQGAHGTLEARRLRGSVDQTIREYGVWSIEYRGEAGLKRGSTGVLIVLRSSFLVSCSWLDWAPGEVSREDEVLKGGHHRTCKGANAAVPRAKVQKLTTIIQGGG